MKKLTLIALLILSACGFADQDGYQYYLSRYNLPDPEPEQFPHCHSYGCLKYYLVTLNKAEWAEIDSVFTPPSRTAEQERERIEIALGKFETIVGGLTGTDRDVGNTFKKMGDGQLDCVDESTNTTIYLDLLKQREHLKFHTIKEPRSRFAIHAMQFWPHQTAVIEETESAQKYAVDSWFDDNGHPAHIVPIDLWQQGWKPKDGKVFKDENQES